MRPSASRENESAAGTIATRPPATALRLRSEERSGSGMSLILGDRSAACPIASGSPTIPGERLAIFLSSAGSIQRTSGARPVNASPISESAHVSVARRSR